jgi:UDP-N-acetylglucosamine transferase subunit ALG13
VVICHAGAGTLGQCIKLGQRPLLVPRLQRFGEAINDHQLMLAQALARQGQAVLCQDREQLAAALQLVQREPTTLDRSQHDQLVPPLLPKLRALLQQVAVGRGKVLD